MADEQQPSRAFITPPPGLLPDAPARDELEGTDSGTRRVSRDGPVFFARLPGAPPPAGQEETPPSSTVTAPPPTPRDSPEASAGSAEPVPSDPTPVWTLQTSDGQQHQIPAQGLIVGRNPSAPEGWEGATLLGVLDPEKTVSKTHAALRPEAGELTVIDLASTNGTTVGTPDGAEVEVGIEHGVAVASDSTICFGSYAVRAARSDR